MCMRGKILREEMVFEAERIAGSGKGKKNEQMRRREAVVLYLLVLRPVLCEQGRVLRGG